MYHFYAFINRMKYINRWGLMRNTDRENLKEHSFQVAVIAHALALIEKERFRQETDPDKAAVIALFHDASEIITGDMPTPVKYYNDGIRNVYKDIEKEVDRSLLRKALETLSEREQTIIRLRFGIDDKLGQELTQKEVADLLGISQSYISRLEKKIMKRLKKEILRLEGR